MEKDGRNRHCELPFKCEAGGYYIHYNEKPIEIGGTKIYVDVPPPPEPDKADNDTDEKEAAKASSANVIVTGKDDKDFLFTGAIKTVSLKADKVKRPESIGKRSYYSFPNGVEAEDICRYLPFNLGNVVKYVCRAGRIDGYTKIEELKKAKDYLDNEIERLKEEFGNEIQGMKDKIAKQKEGDD